MWCSVLASGCCEIAHLWALTMSLGLYFLLLWSEVLMEWMSLSFKSPCCFHCDRCVPGSTVHWPVIVFFFLMRSNYCSHTIGKLFILKEHAISRRPYILSLCCWGIYMLECLFLGLCNFGFSLLVVLCMPIQVKYKFVEEKGIHHYIFTLNSYGINQTPLASGSTYGFGL